MGSFICKQPNGLYCRFSTVVDTVTDYNMTEDDYIQLCMEKAKEDALETLKNHLRPYELVDKNFYPSNMTRKEFKRIKKEMESTNNGLSQRK